MLMRRSIVFLCVLGSVVATVSGCRLFGKRNADSGLTGTDAASPTGGEPTYQPEPYAYPQTTPADSTYGGAPATPSGGRTHTVTKGDTLYALARSYYGDQAKWKSIYEANRSTIGSDPNKIRVGQRLVIP
jgi:nucleoid-associated protein YgaU